MNGLSEPQKENEELALDAHQLPLGQPQGGKNKTKLLTEKFEKYIEGSSHSKALLDRKDVKPISPLPKLPHSDTTKATPPPLPKPHHPNVAQATPVKDSKPTPHSDTTKATPPPPLPKPHHPNVEQATPVTDSKPTPRSDIAKATPPPLPSSQHLTKKEKDTYDATTLSTMAQITEKRKVYINEKQSGKDLKNALIELSKHDYGRPPFIDKNLIDAASQFCAVIEQLDPIVSGQSILNMDNKNIFHVMFALKNYPEIKKCIKKIMKFLQEIERIELQKTNNAQLNEVKNMRELINKFENYLDEKYLQYNFESMKIIAKSKEPSELEFWELQGYVECLSNAYSLSNADRFFDLSNKEQLNALTLLYNYIKTKGVEDFIDIINRRSVELKFIEIISVASDFFNKIASAKIKEHAEVVEQGDMDQENSEALERFNKDEKEREMNEIQAVKEMIETFQKVLPKPTPLVYEEGYPEGYRSR